MFSSLSALQRAGMRSGFVAGDAGILEELPALPHLPRLRRPPVQAASAVAWNDEAHVEENRRLYRDKFAVHHAHARGTYPVAPARRRFLPIGRGFAGHRVRPPAAGRI